MTELVLLLSLWPFHHHKSNADAYWKAYNEAHGCEVQGKLYFFAGDDNMIAFSSLSCEAAITNWKTLHIDPVRMSRA